MDLLTILGNALCDNDFLDQLFDDPFGTVKKYGFHLTNTEHAALEEITDPKRAPETKRRLMEIYTCRQKPCAFAIAPPDDLGVQQQPRTGTEG